MSVPEIVRLATFADLKSAELNLLKEVSGRPRKVPRGTVIANEGDEKPGLYVLTDGWVASSVTRADGGRQVLKVNLPGDMLGLPSLAFTESVETLTALTPATICTILEEAIGKLFVAQPRLAALVFLISQEERVMLIDRLSAMGRSDAGERLAALILQLRARLCRSDPSIGLSFRVPLTQIDIADLTGLTTVHVSRTFTQLREDKLAYWERGVITILDLDGLRRFSGLPKRSLVREPAWLPPAS